MVKKSISAYALVQQLKLVGMVVSVLIVPLHMQQSYSAAAESQGEQDIFAYTRNHGVFVIHDECTPELFNSVILLNAAKENDRELVCSMLDKKADINFQDEKGDTAIRWAAYRGHFEIVSLLLDHNADVNIRSADEVYFLTEVINQKNKIFLWRNDSNDQFDAIIHAFFKHGACVNVPSVALAFIEACRKHNVTTVETLLVHKMDPNVQNEWGGTALMNAAYAYGGQCETVRVLLEYRADPDFVCNEGDIALIQAVTNGHSATIWCDKVDYMLGNTALAQAIIKGNIGIAMLLLKYGANVNVGDSTPLTLAVVKGDGALVKRLLECKANVNLDNSLFMYIVEKWNYYGMANDFLEHGADSNSIACNKSKDTALMRAVYQGRRHMVTLLLKYGAVLEARNNEGETALMKAVCLGKLEMVDMLLSYNTCIDVQDNQGNTALIKAMSSEYGTGRVVPQDRSFMVKKILDCKASINVQNNAGDTALMKAVEEEYDEVVKILISRGADPELYNNRGNSVLAIASAAMKNTVIAALREKVLADIVQQDWDPKTLVSANIVQAFLIPVLVVNVMKDYLDIYCFGDEELYRLVQQQIGENVKRRLLKEVSSGVLCCAGFPQCDCHHMRRKKGCMVS